MQVTLVDHMGTDDSVVNAARVSFSRDALNFSPEQNNRLIKYLATHNHISPFMHCTITLREKVPIFVARQRFKHTVGFAYNEVSRRYVDSDPEFYIPDVWRRKAENKKQGSSDEIIEHVFVGVGEYWHPKEIVNKFTSYSNQIYKTLLESGVAPEQARMVLPQSMYTEYVCTGSLAAFARAYKLRSEESAQMEIQELAALWDKILRPLYPQAWSALVDVHEEAN